MWDTRLYLLEEMGYVQAWGSSDFGIPCGPFTATVGLGLGDMERFVLRRWSRERVKRVLRTDHIGLKDNKVDLLEDNDICDAEGDVVQRAGRVGHSVLDA
jgi:hypothetical protein